MKFANYKFNAKGVNNLGDNMQIITIDYIYQKIGIKLDDVVYIDTNDLSTYKGEYVILPVTMPLVDYQEKGIAGRFSKHIIPVFLGLTMVKDTLSIDEINYLKKYEPIGCRDETTLNTLRKYDIDSYLHGCITICLPKREHQVKNGKTYIVDVDDSFLKYLPSEIVREAVYKTQDRDCSILNPKAEAKKMYFEYLENANLVITSRLHCASPCIAAGIPVIMLKKHISYRMSWLDKLIPIYTLDDVNNINWRPSAIDIEELKQKVLEVTRQRLLNVYNKYKDAYDLSFYYENRPYSKNNYVNDACLSIKIFIDEHLLDKNKEYKYSLWGMTQIAEWIHNYMQTNYPNSKLCHIYDSFRKLKFFDLETVSPDYIKYYPGEIVFVTTNGATKAAKKLFKDINKNRDEYAFVEVIK